MIIGVPHLPALIGLEPNSRPSHPCAPSPLSRPPIIMTYTPSLFLLGLTALLFSLPPSLRAVEKPRPNILWLTSEDNAPLLGSYGAHLAHTPTLDKLAREGVLYERCFAQPVCAPARFTLITGMYAATAGPAQHMRAQGKIPAWLKGFPALLREAGYYTSNNAKTDYNSPLSVANAWHESGKNAHWRKRPTPGQTCFFSVFNHEVTHESCLFPEKELPLDFPPMDPANQRFHRINPTHWKCAPTGRATIITSGLWTDRSPQNCTISKRTVSPTTRSSSTMPTTAACCRAANVSFSKAAHMCLSLCIIRRSGGTSPRPHRDRESKIP